MDNRDFWAYLSYIAVVVFCIWAVRSLYLLCRQVYRELPERQAAENRAGDVEAKPLNPSIGRLPSSEVSTSTVVQEIEILEHAERILNSYENLREREPEEFQLEPTDNIDLENSAHGWIAPDSEIPKRRPEDLLYFQDVENPRLRNKQKDHANTY